MTRETKVGLVVACAFVSLSAVVVWARMHQGTEPAADQANSNNQQAKNTPKTLEPKKPDEPATPPSGRGPPLVTPVTGPPPPAGPGGADLSMPPGLDLPAAGAPSVTPRAPFTVNPPGGEAIPPTPVEPPSPIQVTTPTKTDSSVDLLSKDGKPLVSSDLPGHPLSTPPPLVPPPSVATATTVHGPDAKTGDLLPPNELQPKEPATTPTITLVQGKPNQINLSPAPVVAPAPNNGGMTPPIVDSAPTVSSPPITVPHPPTEYRPSLATQSQVRVYDEETKYCLPTDHSFTDISKRIYGSDKYAQALLLYNRAHPRAHPAVRQSEPKLQSGMPIFVPPVAELERLYPFAISNLAPQSVTSPNPPAVVPSATKPVVSVPVVPSPSLATGVVPVTALSNTADGTKLYKVGTGGEMLYDIARRTLGKGDDWIRIYQLNPQVQPQFAVPAGSLLRLPAEAKLIP